MYAIVWIETRRVGVVAAEMEGKLLAMTVLTPDSLTFAWNHLQQTHGLR